MRGKSHLCLGVYLVKHYMKNIPMRYIKAFQFGCIEPDHNPITYLKGSFRCQWLRGHNYCNARHFMNRVAIRLENRTKLNLYDYYSLGKLIHYTTDAFTYAHNSHFPAALCYHRQYEKALQDYFLEFLAQAPKADTMNFHSIMDVICSYHRDYEQTESNIHNDSRFALSACCCVLANLFIKPIV